MSPRPSRPRGGPAVGRPLPAPLARKCQASGCLCQARAQGFVQTAFPLRWTDSQQTDQPLVHPQMLTRQYSSMGFSLLTATSRMWLLRKRILPGREMLVSQAIQSKAAMGIWPPHLVPLSLWATTSAEETREGQSPPPGGKRPPKLWAQDLSGR